ncbi:DUF5672 family protein [Telluribacter sp.]|jgi:hypothetical protein|uniref:DUF5672 family protein n=1 Tax=Telluribacter sp. TaxID=1978767 RepID=UPI002E0EC802|nr:DUF5672 family protein [Telluribacter sp.]
MKSSSTRPVAVVIPIYKSDLSAAEKASLRQCLQVLSAYPLIVVKPAGLVLDSLQQEYPALQFRSFEDQFFSSIVGYNELLVSLTFYKAFTDFEYILIYQLDAYVFRDELPHWCAKGYDNIGAPSLEPDELSQLPAEAQETYATVLTESHPVLNGGLSLRRIPAIIRYLRIYNAFYTRWPGNEDKLFSLDARRLAPMKFFIKLPSWQEALAFSFEKSPAASYALNNRQLPFGCHAWERYDPEFWKPFIPVEE